MAEELSKELEKLSIRSERPKSKKPTKKEIEKLKKEAEDKKKCDELRLQGFLRRSSPIVENPVAIFIVGPVASGKTTTLNKLLPKDFDYDYYNLDDYHEYLLEQHEFIKTDKVTQQKVKNLVEAATNILYKKALEENPSLTKEEFIETIDKQILIDTYNSMFTKLLSVANKCIQQDYNNLISPDYETKNIVIDTTGGNYDKIQEQKYSLEAKGYKTLMIALYSSLETTKRRNEERYRTVPSGGVYGSWLSTISNLPKFKEELFGEEDFYLINTDPTVKEKTIDVTVKDKVVHLEFDKEIQEIKEAIYNTILLRQGKHKSDSILRPKISTRRKAASL